MTNNLQHIAIIMDGNNRWAKQRNLPGVMGHKAGAEAAKKAVIGCMKLKIPFLTLYAFSSENWQRNPKEVDSLLSLLKFYLSNEIDTLVEQQVRVRFIGNTNRFSADILELIDRCENKTKDNKRLNLQIALSYGAREEILEAQKKLYSDLRSGKMTLQLLDEDVFASYLYTKNIPDPDLLIRTSGEYRISNFLLWQIAYTELYFTKLLWPDFNITHLKRAIANYNKRERRYGLSK